MSDPKVPNPSPAAEDLQPSGLGLLLKAFVLPTLLVALFIAIWMMVRLLTVAPADANSCVERLGQSGNDRWRAAVDLAGILQDPDHAALKTDRVLAQRLAGILQREIESGRMSNDDVTLRMYLCRALGEFQTDDGLDVLIRAGTTGRDPHETDVRRAAIEAVAVRAGNVGAEAVRPREGLMPMLVEASRADDEALRSTAAFTLGVVGGEEAEGRLAELLADGQADVRYNAATGLARHGNPAATRVLLEMLNPQQQPAARDTKRRMILVNALRAIGQLAAANPSAITPPVLEAVRRLTQGDVAAPVRVTAIGVLSTLEEAARPAESSAIN